MATIYQGSNAHMTSLTRQQKIELASALAERERRINRKKQSNPKGGLLEFVRYFWHVLEPVDEMVEGWPLECLCAHLEAVTNGETVNIGDEIRPLNRLWINVPPGFMKLCADSTPILTPDGYRTHGDLKVGDYVFGPDGKPTEIIRVSPKAPADYEVTFSTHETIKCNGDHLWHVYDRFAKKYKTMATRELFGAATEKDRNRFFIPDTRCLEFPERDLPLHPYFLGCWLGDGASSKPAISHSVYDVEHIAKLDSLGYRVTAQYKQNDTRHSNFRHQGVLKTLREMNLWKNKHIPDAYLTASEDQRLELLAGLIDTDGTVDKERERVMFYTCDPSLADAVQRLVLSLGMRPYVTLMDAPGYGEYESDKTYHLIGFQPTRSIPTVIPRKRIVGRDFAKRKRAIVSVTKSSAPEMGHCITVARPDGLYVVGRTNLVTHNSMLTNVMWPAWEWGPMGLPHLRYVAFSYSPELTERDNAKFRDLITSPSYRELWGHVFKVVGDGKIRVTNDKTGYKFASSFGGVGTGERGHRVILDDLHKIKGTAETDEARASITNWVREGSQNRLNDIKRDVIVGIMQRVHENDSSGVVQRHLGNDYCCLIVPMEYESGRHFSHYRGWNDGQDPRTRDGELAWPNRFGRRELASFKANNYLWAGQYQQRPVPRGGGLFKEDWWQTYPIPASGNYEFTPILTVASLDTAFKEKEENDFSALTIWSVYEDQKTGHRRIMLVDAWKKKLPLHGTRTERQNGEDEKSYLRRAAPKWGLCEWVAFSCSRRRVNTLLIEDSARGTDVSAEIRRIYRDKTWGTMLIPARGDKWTRAHSVVSMFVDEMIYAPGQWVEEDWHWRDWAAMVIDEMCTFPRGTHDDLVDSSVQALRYLRDNDLAIRREERDILETELRTYKKPLSPLYDV